MHIEKDPRGDAVRSSWVFHGSDKAFYLRHKKRGDSVQDVPILNGSRQGNNGSVGHREIGDYVKTVPQAMPKRRSKFSCNSEIVSASSRRR